MSATPRYATPRTPRRSTLGGEVAAIAAELGKPLLPFQREYVDVAMEVDAAGHLVYRTCALSLPRQSGKTTLMCCLLLHRCLIWGERQHVIYSCQTALAAGKRVEEIDRLLRESSLADQVEHVSRAIGDQSITFTNGSVLSIVSGTEGSGHGGTYGLVVLDECWEKGAERRDQALRPATIAVPDSQVWLCSTAGTADSTFWRRYVDVGRLAVSQGTTTGLAYAEWSAEDGAPLDPATLGTCMPALGTLIDVRALLSDLVVMEPGAARRAFLNQWTVDDGAQVISDELWESLHVGGRRA
jgi:phage terminase large subunit-like protein